LRNHRKRSNIVLFFQEPQGYVLEPLFFQVYINDIGDKLLSLSCLFVDGTSLGYESQDEDQIKYASPICTN
jgi:hypothetical protein